MKRILLIAISLFILVGTQYSCKSKKQIQNGITEVSTPVLIGGYAKKDMHFKVQIGAFEVPLAEDADFFAPVVGKEVRIDISPQGFHRYSVGFFKSYPDSDAYERELKAMGYEQAFVVAYGDDNQRIELPMDEILRLYNMAE
ncbi:MAG: SPOR domain-containing protein [Chitinophagales bacterium]